MCHQHWHFGPAHHVFRGGSREPFAEDAMAAVSALHAAIGRHQDRHPAHLLTSLDEFKALMKRLEGKPIKFLAEKVETGAEYDPCVEALVFPLWLIFWGTDRETRIARQEKFQINRPYQNVRSGEVFQWGKTLNARNRLQRVGRDFV
jgi:hypothetical protein